MSFMDDPESSERSYLVGQAFKPNEDSGKRVSGVCCNLSGRSSLMVMGSQQTRVNSFFRRLSDHWLPSDKEDSSLEERSWKRRLFLLLTEPETSLGSAIFYFVLIFAIFASNIIMIMQTMKQFQFTPDDCRSCGG